jgi:hypothetical protein
MIAACMTLIAKEKFMIGRFTMARTCPESKIVSKGGF